MLSLIILILGIVSLFKPEVLLSKKMKEKCNEEQKKILAKNLRKIDFSLILLLEYHEISKYYKNIETIYLIILLILFFVLVLPASKEIQKIKKELNK